MKKIDIVFSFDTTGSMYPALSTVRSNLNNVFPKLFSESNSDLRISLIAHGDYCDHDSASYVIKTQDFTADIGDLRNFVNNTAGKTGGGDAPECYELVIREVSNYLSWREDSVKVVVIIGDEQSHHNRYRYKINSGCLRRNSKSLTDYYDNGCTAFDIFDEISKLERKFSDISIIGVQCLNAGYRADGFYEKISDYHIKLAQFNNIPQLINSVVLKSHSDEKLKEYESELISYNGLNRDVANIIDSLLKRKKSTAKRIYGDSDLELEKIHPSRFQVLYIDNDYPIKEFVEDSGAVFRKGNGFYQWTKSVAVQETKEVVLRHKLSGDFYCGKKARDMIGIPFGIRDKLRKISGNILEKYDVFIQSTSYNRKLLKDTYFLYDTK